MSKQSSLFTFMSRNDKDTTKTTNSTDVSVPVKSTGKFKFNAKPRLQQKTNTDENQSTNSVNNLNGFKTASSILDCLVISDEDGVSPVKIAKTDKMDEDLLGDFKPNDMIYTKPSSLVKNQINTMDDLYTKYGSPKADSKCTFDSFDIDKELKSNASYVSAMKKLDENMAELKKSPKKTTTTSKFKFNTRSKPATQNTINSSSSGANFSSSNTTIASNKTTSAITPVLVNKYAPETTSQGESALINTTKSMNSSTNISMNSCTTASSLASNSHAALSNSHELNGDISVSPIENSINSNEGSL